MYEFHGWVNIVADDSDEPESSVLQMRQNELIAALQDRVQALRSSPYVFVHIARNLNGEAHFLISGCRNHRDDRLLALFRWIAEHQPCSYGLLHIRDDEDADGYDNAFAVHAIRRGEIVSAAEHNLSPCVPLLEPSWQAASNQGSEPDDRRDEQLRPILAIGHDTSIRGDGISFKGLTADDGKQRAALIASATYVVSMGVLFAGGAGILAAYLTLPASWFVIGNLSEQVARGSAFDAALSSWAGNLVLLLLSAMLNVAAVYGTARLLSKASSTAEP